MGRTLLLLMLMTGLVGTAQAAESVFPIPADVSRGAEPDTTDIPAPHRSREDIEADIQALEVRRADLLTRFAPAHPDVRAVERRLAILRAQLEMLRGKGKR